VEVRFEFSDENGAHLAEKLGVAKSENPLITPHAADVVLGLHARCIFVAECRHALSLSSQLEMRYFRRKTAFFK
jgi:hypothetical protein